MHLYIHIPFCLSKCSYCDFNSYPISAFSHDIINNYISAICNEIKKAKIKINKNILLKTIYIGGGTPSILKNSQLKKITESINNNFKLSKNLEFTIECNPETITKTKLNFYKKIGVNRISLGVQTFDDNILKIINRIGNSKTTISAVDLIKKTGFSNISFDFIYALPNQTTDLFIQDLQKAVSLKPTHISIYCLTLNPYSEKYFNSIGAKIPNEDTQIQMYRKATNFLKKHKYYKYEISNFAIKGFESKHNLSYWQHRQYIGIGAGASSYINGYRTKNISNVKTYIDSILNDKNYYEENYKLNEKEIKSEFVFLSLRLSGGLNLIKYKKRFKKSFFEDYKEFLKIWEGQKLFKIEKNSLTLTEKGILLSDEIFRELF